RVSDRTMSARSAPDAIAIVGAACRFPGGIVGLDGLWDAFAQGRSFRAPVPPSRFDHERLAALLAARGELVPPRYGNFQADGDLMDFDPEFFGMSPREAAAVDPQQRVLLELVWEACAGAGMPVASLAGGDAGVYVGLSNVDYHRLQFRQLEGIGPHSGTGTSPSIAANRISYAFDLRGPSLAVDTACSSALVALQLACDALRAGTVPLALVGSANVILDPTLYVSFARSHMLSGDGLCKTFDASADGFARGEGAALVVLKRAADALRDGDRVLALVRGGAVNQDGTTNGLTAPSGVSQSAVIERALVRAGVDPAGIGFVEAHGTGTALGDPIEFRALARTIGAHAPGAQPCYVGSAKTNFGHLEAAAGILGLLKAALAVHHRAVPPTLHLANVNPRIDLTASRLRFPTRLEAWPSGEPARAAVSAFGFGGTNAHVVVEEFVPAGEPAARFALHPPPLPFRRRRLMLDLPDVSAWFAPAPAAPAAAAVPALAPAASAPTPGGDIDAYCYACEWVPAGSDADASAQAEPAREVTRVVLVATAEDEAAARALWRDAAILVPGAPLPARSGPGGLEIVDLRAARLSGARSETVTPEAAVDEACERVGAFAALLREAAALPGPVRIDVVTCGALPAAPGDVPQVGGAALAGAFQSAALESPQLVGNLIDLPADFGARDAAALVALPRAAVASALQVAIRAGIALVPVLERRAVPALAAAPLRAGVYAVLGGFGSLGLVAARALAERGAREIALVGRGGASEAAAPALAELRARGVALRELRADVADANGFAALLARLRAQGRPLRGIVHCAGTLGALAPVAELRAQDVRAAAAVKAIPALCADGELDLFVAFSSIASTWGSRGIGAYAAANALLDAAAARLARHGKAVVLEGEEALGYHSSGRSVSFSHYGIG
ncbi:MAG: hypothetical protein QOI11_721, partial [Candidatus Eremiobacteraeota bacterium]|nr:hypothetical protein [Candidatus Eremiobacteraeota bacterium]